ncbi:MAG TPA: hypothetical protein VJ946_10245, partial [Bacteroidales bacterium]|nr:hypothetical protein [Bacteroidales bacterium]
MQKTKTIWEHDPWLEPYQQTIISRMKAAREKENNLLGQEKTLSDFANGHHYFGLHRTAKGWVFREWAPNATAIFLVGSFSGWEEREDYQLHRKENDVWERHFDYSAFQHEDLYKLMMHWDGGSGERLPAYAGRVVQDNETKIFSAQVWEPDKPFPW